MRDMAHQLELPCWHPELRGDWEVLDRERSTADFSPMHQISTTHRIASCRWTRDNLRVVVGLTHVPKGRLMGFEQMFCRGYSDRISPRIQD